MFAISYKERKVLFVLACLICLGLSLQYINRTFSCVKIFSSPQSSHADRPLTVNINEASIEELMSLPGVGEVIALRIIKEREKGEFTASSDLLRVKGIGEKKLERIKNHLSF